MNPLAGLKNDMKIIKCLNPRPFKIKKSFTFCFLKKVENKKTERPG